MGLGYPILCYDANRMKKQVRRSLFVIFLGAFLITAPMVVLYTAGYRYNFGTGQVVQTGILSVGSTPKGAEIVINEKSAGATTPALLKNVFPGDHEVAVQKDGYSSWTKTLAVESRATTFADDVVLFLDGTPALLRETGIRGVSVNPSGTKAAYAETKGQWTEIWIDGLSDRSEILVSRLPVGIESDIRFAWLRGGTVLSITATGRGVTTTTLVDTETGSAVASLPASGVVLSAAADLVAVSRAHGESNEILAYVPFGEYAVGSAPGGTIQLEDAGRHRLLLVSSSGGDQPIVLNVNATHWQWEPAGNRLLYTDGFDLHVYDAASHTDETITRLSSPVTWVAWYPGHSYVLYAQDDAIYAAELDRRGERNVTRLVSGSNLRSFAPSANGATLWFFGTVNGASGLFERKLQR